MRHAQLSAIGLALLGLLAIFCVAPAQAGRCAVQSGARVQALVELYTADNCAACQPAERWLSTLAARSDVLPVALHVDSGDYTGARRRIYERQRRLTARQRMALVYAPQVLVQGRAFQAMETAAIEAELAWWAERPARARISLEIVSAGPASMVVRASAAVDRGEAVLYVASFERQAQRRLVLEWHGPFDLRIEKELPLLPGALPSRSGAAAFVRDRRGGEVLQALALPAC